MKSQNRLIVRLGGGLGNQLFMFAAGYALARRHHRKFLVDTSWYLRRGHRRLELDRFRVPLDVAFEGDWRRNLLIAIDTTKPALARITRIVGSLAEIAFQFSLVREGSRTTCNDRIIEGLPDRDVYLVGYFHDARYFSSAEDELRDMLTLREAPGEATQRLLDDVVADPSWVSVHVRRGDYARKASENVLPLSYYTEASSLVAERIARPKWLVFSDDPAWARTTLVLAGDKRVVEHNRDRPWEDLTLMAACRGHIIANSTFSWWGAYLGRCRDPVVVVPTQWYPLGRKIPDGLVLPNWVAVRSKNLAH